MKIEFAPSMFEKLLSYNLSIDNRRLMLNVDTRKEAEAAKAVLQEFMPEAEFIIEDYALDVNHRNPPMCYVSDIENINGFSVWQVRRKTPRRGSK